MVERKMLALVCAAFLAACVLNGVRAEEHHHDHDHGAKGPHGGALQELGDKDDTHAELMHDEKAGKLTLYLIGKDGKTPVAIKDAPKLNLKAKDGNKQIEMKAVDAKEGAASQYEATDDALKADPLDGRISITLADGKKYNVKLDH
ncbi:MAG: hypothetical protein KIS92_16585 [Planctomycetota bacterium]|nr:hypothetical protein [Planctomycetota bacterium]